ncbi:FtsX-like permease family protein, partial [Clostridium sp. DFI.1.208]|uniref:FtsX-like permease family protein n=1 Tax=Clostridium sp. DFI.1.208 TaxID=2965527 RepID=UPI00210B1BB8|nr:FtsX-like permease family protein [Clostridium sp. DFI.1.208]
FNTFSSQEQVLNLSTSQSTVLKTVGQIMNVLSVFVAIVLAFLILYANNFLIRRRNQEFGIYMLLGMPNRDISRILVYETMAVGFLSLLSGLLLG